MRKRIYTNNGMNNKTKNGYMGSKKIKVVEFVFIIHKTIIYRGFVENLI